MDILICGYGNIGKHTYNEFDKRNVKIDIYDKYKEEYSTLNINHKYNASFVCVPTEMNGDGTVNTTEIFDIVDKAKQISDVVIIKSAIPVGTAKKLGYDKIVVSPEYYGTTQHSLESPNFAVLGGLPQDRAKAAEIYQAVKDASFKFILTTSETAELAKYMENCWLATKVTFCNEFATIAESVGVDYNELRECFIADERVNPSHTFVYKDKPYYDSHCLNKDIPGLITQCDKLNIDTPLMDSVFKINTLRKQQ